MVETDELAVIQSILKKKERINSGKKGIMSAALIAALALSTGQAASAAGAATSGEVDLTNTPVKNSEVTPFANEDVGGGNWDYGTSGYFDWGIKRKFGQTIIIKIRPTLHPVLWEQELIQAVKLKQEQPHTPVCQADQKMLRQRPIGKHTNIKL